MHNSIQIREKFINEELPKILEKKKLQLNGVYKNTKHRIPVICLICQHQFDISYSALKYSKNTLCKKCKGYVITIKQDILNSAIQNNITIKNNNIPYTIPLYYSINLHCNNCHYEWSRAFRNKYTQIFLCPQCAQLPKESEKIITGIIYKATLIKDNRVYIGQTIQPFCHRKYIHIKSAFDVNSLSYNTKFARAIRKYGIDEFNWEIIHNNIPWNDLNTLEIQEIKNHNSFNNGFNSTEGGQTELISLSAQKSFEKRKIRIQEKIQKQEEKSLSNFENNIKTAIRRFEKEKQKTTQEELQTQVKRFLSGKKKYKNNTPDSSQYRGVCFDKQNNKWKASIKYQGKKIHIGLFVEEIEAAKSYDSKAKQLHGSKAKLNF